MSASNAGRRVSLALASLALAGFTLASARADDTGNDAEGHGVTATPIFVQKLANVPGKTMTTVSVDYAPGGASAPHRHAASAAIFAYVSSGAIRSQLEDGGPAKVYHAGESWYEGPGAHHLLSENASATDPARLIVVFIADDGAQLTTFDAAK
jgi:quercetin dioxygenase-like cupin family protein